MPTKCSEHMRRTHKKEEIAMQQLLFKIYYVKCHIIFLLISRLS